MEYNEFVFPLPSVRYKVVIYCQTYNQHEYLEDTLKGFVSQKTNFPFCAVVIDDCSTDSQQDIIMRYAKEYPDIIIPILLPYNHFRKGENKDRYMKPWIEHSEYVAMCEGDDYWISSDKLQKQADFLDSNQDCSLTYHACKNLYTSDFSGEKYSFGEVVREEYNVDDLLLGYYFQTATIMFRSTLWKSDFFQKVINILHFDYIIYFCAAVSGRVVGVNEQMSIYRRSNQGISNCLYQEDKIYLYINRWLKIAEQCDKSIKIKVHEIAISSLLYRLYKCSSGKFKDAFLLELKLSPRTALKVTKRIAIKRIKDIIKYLLFKN